MICENRNKGVIQNLLEENSFEEECKFQALVGLGDVRLVPNVAQRTIAARGGANSLLKTSPVLSFLYFLCF